MRWVWALHSSPIIHIKASMFGTPEYVPWFHQGWLWTLCSMLAYTTSW